MAAKRSYGTGGLTERADSTGVVTYYGKWRSNGVHVKRALGPKRVKGSRDGLTRAQAEAEMRRLMREVKPAATPAGQALTIGELGRRHLLEVKRRGAKKSTCTAIETALRIHLEPVLGDRTIGSVSREDVADLVATLKGKGLKPKSVHNYVSTLATLYRFAVKEGWATVNPCDGVKLDAVPKYKELRRHLEPEQIEQLVAHADAGAYQELDGALFRTAAMTGLRLGELCALRWRNVHWLASAISVESSWVKGEFGTPKSDKSRSVPMADPVAGTLERWFKLCGEPGEGELVFGDPHVGGPLEKTAVLRRMRKALKGAELDETRRFHDLRHTFGTAMAAAGVPMRTLQEWMGHGDMQTTLLYARYSPRARDAELVAAAFNPSRGLVRGLDMSESKVT